MTHLFWKVMPQSPFFVLRALKCSCVLCRKWPSKAKKLFLKRIERFFLKSGIITHISKEIFWTKNLRGCVTSSRFSLQNFFKKWTFFKFFCIFRISLMSWLEKWSFFPFDEFWFSAFLALTAQNLTSPHEVINVQKCLRIS